MSFFAMYFISAPFSPFMLIKRPLLTLHISSIISILGVWLKFIAGSNYFVALLGQFLLAILSPFILPGATVIPRRWFLKD